MELSVRPSRYIQQMGPRCWSQRTKPSLNGRSAEELPRFFSAGRPVLCEGPSEVQAYAYFASALKIDMDKNGISLIAVDGSHFLHLLRVMSEDALCIPWVVSSDGDKLLSLGRQLADLGKVSRAQINNLLHAGTLETTILRPHDVFTLPNEHNFEQALIYGGAASEYQQCIENHIDANALHDFVSREQITANTLEEQLCAFMKSDSRSGGRNWKVLFADIVADQITKGGTDDSRIPSTIVDALELAHNYATGSAVKVF